MSYQASFNHSFDVKLAAELNSIELAILVHHFQYWINKNQELGRNFIDGCTWTYQTREEIASHFPYLTKDQVRRLTDKLVSLKILKKGNYNKKGMDKTIWYAFVNEENFTIGKSANSSGKSANLCGNSAKAIPHTKTDTKPQNKVVVGEDTPSPCNDEKKIRKDDVYHYSLTARKDWKPEEIESAWIAYSGAIAPISDPYAYIHGIIKKKRILAEAKQNKDKTCQKKHKKNNLESTEKTKRCSKRELETTSVLPSVQDTPGPLLDFLKSRSYIKKR